MGRLRARRAGKRDNLGAEARNTHTKGRIFSFQDGNQDRQVVSQKIINKGSSEARDGV